MNHILGEHTARLAEEKKPKTLGENNPDDVVPTLDKYGEWTSGYAEERNSESDMGYGIND